MENIVLKDERELISNNLIPIDVNHADFERLMNLYEDAKNKLLNRILELQEDLKKTYEYDIIHNVTSRIKTPDSIRNKMKKKRI